MRIVISSDWHIHKWKQFSLNPDFPGVNWRLMQCLFALQWVLREEGFHVFCGDLFESKFIDPDTMNFLLDTLQKFKRPIYAIAGNHDIVSQAGTSNVTVLHKAGMLFQADKDLCPGLCNFGDFEASGPMSAFISYQKDETVFAEMVKSIPPVKMLFCHQVIYGVNDGNHTYTVGIRPEIFKGKAEIVFNGHIHQPCDIQEAAPGVRIIGVGSPLQQRFGEIGDRGYWVWDDGKIEFFTVPCPKFLQAETTEQLDRKNYWKIETGKENVDYGWNVQSMLVKSKEPVIEKHLVCSNDDPFLKFVNKMQLTEKEIAIGKALYDEARGNK